MTPELVVGLSIPIHPVGLQLVCYGGMHDDIVSWHGDGYVFFIFAIIEYVLIECNYVYGKFSMVKSNSIIITLASLLSISTITLHFYINIYIGRV